MGCIALEVHYLKKWYFFCNFDGLLRASFPTKRNPYRFETIKVFLKLIELMEIMEFMDKIHRINQWNLCNLTLYFWDARPKTSSEMQGCDIIFLKTCPQ